MRRSKEGDLRGDAPGTGPKGGGSRGVLLCIGLSTVFVAGALLMTAVTAAAPATAGADEYEKRRAQLAKELAQEHFVLGKWCQEQKLSREACEHFEQVLKLQPDHEGAKTELGRLDTRVTAGRHSQCELCLQGGAIVKAELLTDTLRVETDSGSLFIPVENIDVIRIGAGETPDLIVADGFFGRARIREESFAAKAKVGLVSVKRGNVDQIRILRRCAACDGEGKETCKRCEGKGRIYETVPCEECGGTGKVQCDRCGGTGRLTCPRCGGSGWTAGLFGGFRFKCGRCNGRGTVDCSRCKKGMMVCPTCKGKPVTVDKGPCPDCQGKKTVPCAACGGTGVKPLPPDVEKEVKKALESPLNE